MKKKINQYVKLTLKTIEKEGLWKTIKKIIAFLVTKKKRNILYFNEHYLGDRFYPIYNKTINNETRQQVDIIICVHNALDDVKKCLESVFLYSSSYRLIIVNDGSDALTSEYLEVRALEKNALLLRNDVAQGYTKAANFGLRNSTNEYIILLNSDTIVSDRWIDNMINVFQQDAGVGMVGPLSNTASWQSIPRIFKKNGDWANNSLNPENIKNYSDSVNMFSSHLYPIVGFLNGFCLMISRRLINEIGLLDEENFPKGYGEENDYCLRVLDAGYRIRVCDSTFIYHSQSKSYSNEKRMELVKVSDLKLIQKHSREKIHERLLITSENPILFSIREASKKYMLRQVIIKNIKEKYKNKRILFLLPVRFLGGGANVIINECETMLNMGIKVSILNYNIHKIDFENSYKDLKIEVPIIYIDSEDDIQKIFPRFDCVVATMWKTVELLLKYENSKSIVKGYYIQDFEPDFYKQNSEDYKKSLSTYNKKLGLVSFTKSKWNQEKIIKYNKNIKVIGASYNNFIYKPRKNYWEGSGKIKICGMVRYETPRRNPKFTKDILEYIASEFKERVEVSIFGSPLEDYKKKEKEVQYYSLFNRSQMVYFLNSMDIFVDFSDYQAMGLTAIEAMATGCAVVLPKNGGCLDYSKHLESAILVNTKNKKECTDAIVELINDISLRLKLKKNAVTAVSKLTTEKVILKMMKYLFSDQKE